MKMTPVSDQVTIGPQPTADDVQSLRDQGFKTVVNFRNAAEDTEQLSPEAEGESVQAQGMEYLHIPVTMKVMSSQAVDQFRTKFSQLPKPVFAHCKSGKRAGAMVLMAMAVEQGLTGEQTLQRADEMGLGWDQPELRTFVKGYVDNQPS